MTLVRPGHLTKHPPLGQAWAIFRSLLPSAMVVSAPSRSDFSHLTFGNYSGLIRGLTSAGGSQGLGPAS